MRVDVHQHIWTEPLLTLLAARTAPPLVRIENGLTVLHCAAEAPYVIDLIAEAPLRRAALVHDDGLDLALLAPSSPIGIEALPADEALELIEAHLAGVESLPGAFAVWGPVALNSDGPDQVDRVLERGCVGVSLPAGALAGADALEQVGPILERVATQNVPLLVHPGRAPGQRPNEIAFGEPPWWRALTDYVTQMQAAWLTFAAFGRREHPELIIVFAMLAGCAPMLSERLVARGGRPTDTRDPRTFYDTSSFGPAAVEAMGRFVGARQLVYGSDRPVVDPLKTGMKRLLQENGAALLAGLGARV